jgi:uncharacterized LabA/DUF88 family protein
MDRCAIFVDAGYLYAEGGELCCGTKSRQQLQLDASQVVELLATMASNACGLPVLRTYWYDGARDGVPTQSQQVIASLPNVKLRMGRLNARNQQKGVDALIYRDLMTLARERAICEAFLLSGDEDLREGVRAAQDQGVRVTLVGIEPASQSYNQSRALVQESDEVARLGRQALSSAFSLLAQVPTAPRKPATTKKRVERLGRNFGETWLSKATDDELSSLKAQRPKIPTTVDAELLRFAEQALGFSLHGQDEHRHAVRSGFWGAIGAMRGSSGSVSGSSAPTGA